MAGERALPGLGLFAFWTLGSNGYKTQLDSNIRLLSALVQARVKSAVGALPGGAVDGDIHILTSDKSIQIRDAGAWVGVTALEGWIVYNLATDTHLKFDGTDWVAAFSSTDYSGDIAALDTRVDALELEPGTGAEIAAAYEAVADVNRFTDAEKAKLATLEDGLFMGLYASEAALTTANPDALPGSYAFVDAGGGQPTRLFLWDDGDATWSEVEGGGGTMDAATIAALYEGYLDANRFTDAEKAQVADHESRLDTFDAGLVISSYTATTNYDVTNTDMDGAHVLRMNNAAACTVTIPAGLTGKGPFIVVWDGVGQVSFVASGVTIRSPDSKVALGVRYAQAGLIRTGTNVYQLSGYLV